MSEPHQANGSNARADKPSQSAVFEQLTRRRGWPSARDAMMLAVILSSGGCVCAFLAAQATQGPAFRALSIVLIALPLGSLMVALVSPFAAGVISAIGTVRDADPDMLQLLRLTNVSPRDIVNGYVKAALYRLRLLWAICYGLLLPLWGAIVVIIGSPLIYRSTWELVDYAWPAFWIMFCGAVLGTGLNWLAVCAGVSAALRWRNTGHAAGAAAGSVLAAYLVLAAALYCGLVAAVGTTPSSAGGMIVTVSVVAAVFFGVAGYGSLQSARVKL